MLGWLKADPRRRTSTGTLAVYTAIFGDIPDPLHPPRGYRTDPEVRYVCFTDRADRFDRSEPWEIRPAVWTHPDPRRMARYHKVLSHLVLPEADFSLWLDGNIRLMIDPWTIIDRHLVGGHEIATFRHPDRNCVYEELEACIRLEKDGVERMRRQVDGYRAEGYPPRLGLAETRVVARRHSNRVREFNRAWWSELDAGSVRDQLSFNVVLWRLGLDCGFLKGQSLRSPYVQYTRHR
jgi:hypothetical protein